MHPDIQKFWEKLGKIDFDLLETPVSVFYWYVIYTETKNYTYVASKPLNTEIVKYYFRGNSFDETEMLRIIKLKAFL